MGKKGKKNNKAQDSDPLLSNEGKQELEDNHFNFNSKTNNDTDSVKKSKKKNRKRNLDDTTKEDLLVHIEDEEIKDSIISDPTVTKIKKEKKKKHTKFNEQELCEEVQNDNHTEKLNEVQPPTPKKKKKSNKILGKEDKMAIDPTPVITEEYKEQKDSKKKKNKDSLLNDEKGSKTQNKDEKQSKKRSGKKAKTGAPVLNDEEAQVTEEDIDRFIDELDEEDNKQYEDWVKLLDAKLSKKQQTD